MPNPLRRKMQPPSAESSREENSRVVDLTESADQVSAEDYPVLVFLRDQLQHAQEETEKLRHQLAESQGPGGETDPRAQLSDLRAHFEKQINDERTRRQEVEASLESERLLRMEAEAKTKEVQGELARARLELRTASGSQDSRRKGGASATEETPASRESVSGSQ